MGRVVAVAVVVVGPVVVWGLWLFRVPAAVAVRRWASRVVADHRDQRARWLRGEVQRALTKEMGR